MSKYEPLGAFLRAQKFQSVPMTFAEIEKILKFKLPASKKYPAWWSNNPSNNVMTQQWLDAGFETASVDTQGEKLVFRRRNPGTANPEPDNNPSFSELTGARRGSIFGCMKGLFTLSDGFDPTAPMELEPGWDKQYWPNR